MKQRVTYLLRNAHEQGGVDPATLDVSKESLRIPGLDAAKEWRITVGASELPQEVHLIYYRPTHYIIMSLHVVDLASVEAEP